MSFMFYVAKEKQICLRFYLTLNHFVFSKLMFLFRLNVNLPEIDNIFQCYLQISIKEYSFNLSLNSN